MTIERRWPSWTGGDREVLEGWLDYQRATLEVKCAGLDEEQLKRRSVPPSTMTLLGLVRHMAEVERGWFQADLAAAAPGPIYSTEEHPDGEFDLVDGADVDEAFTTWRAECDRSRQVLATFDSLDAVATEATTGDALTPRWVVTHMIEEYARHNGHADLLRECIDGATGE